MKKYTYSTRIPPPSLIEQVRESAKNGAASLLGHGRLDVVQEMAAITVQKYLLQVQVHGVEITNPRSWAYRVGKNEATAWIAREMRFVSLDEAPACSNEQDKTGNQADQRDFRRPGSDYYRGQEEVLQALPELFEWFQERIINQLDPDDRLFYERYFWDHWSEDQIAAELGISAKAVAQRWRRLLVRMRRKLTHELPNWELGNELFSEAFEAPNSLGDLLCLIRLFIEQGIGAIREIISSISGQ